MSHMDSLKYKKQPYHYLHLLTHATFQSALENLPQAQYAESLKPLMAVYPTDVLRYML